MTASHSSIKHPPTASAQYASFRSNPAEFPAFDRLRFLRLNDELLPAALRSTSTTAAVPRLLHHPVLLYHSIPELIRDAHLDAMTKHRLILEYRREKRCVGRLIGWRTVTAAAASVHATDNDDTAIYFPDASVDLIRIPSLSDAEADGTVVEFYDSLPSFEETCASLESYADIPNGTAITTSKEGDARELREYCLRWRNAVHCALNMSGMDLGGVVSPLSVSADHRVRPTGAARIRDKRKALGDVSNRKKRKETAVEKAAFVERRTEQNTESKSTRRETPQISPHAPWAQVWKILRSVGWTWKGGSGLMTDYYYIKPDRRIKDGIERVDYFTKVEDVREFCRAEYGWIGEDRTECDSKKKNVGESNVDTGDDRDENVPTLSTPLDPYTSWRSAWDILLSSGWTWKAGSGLMTDYYYIKPGKKIKGGICGVDYFARREDLEEYMKRNYGWIGEVERGLLGCTEGEKTDMKRESSELETGQKKKPKVPKSKVEKAKSKPAKTSTKEPQSLELEDDAFQKNKKPKVAKIKVNKPKPKPTKATTEELPASIVRETQPPARQEPKWKDLWAALKKEGWTVKTAGKYNPLHDWYYIRPGADPADPSALLGEHYFLEAQDVMDYCMIHRSDVVDAIEREKGRNEAVAAAAARAAAVAAEEAESAATREPTWKEVWTDLRKEGWKVESAGKYNKLHNWYYIRPGVNPSDDNAFLGQHYFLELEDVMDFIKRQNNSSESNTLEDSVSATSDDVSKSDASNGSREVEETPVKPERVNTAAAKKALWKQLQSEGWTVEKASKWNNLHDWYYIRPWVDPANPTAELGVDYFLCLDDVMNFVNNSSSVQDEESVVEHVAKDDAVSNEEPPKTVIDWKSLWIDLKKAGWDVVSAGKFNRLHDWYYLKPGVNPADEHSRLGEDYFLTPGDVIDFIEASGFNNVESKSIEDSDRAPVNDTPTQETSNTKPSNSEDPQTPLDCQTKPQDPAIPLPSSPESSTASDDDSYEWHNLWKRLKMAGWTYVKAGKYNKLHDGYYVRPGRDPGDENCELGKHYFMSQDDVIQFEKMREENEAKKKSERESMDVMQVIFEKEAEMQVEGI